MAAFLWRRLDQPGLDSCRLLATTSGWRLTGTAVMQDAGRPCHLHYDVDATAAWISLGARVQGYLGDQRVDLRIRATAAGAWRLDGRHVEGLEDCVDVDLGFTPATNLLVLRRLALEVGERAEAPAACLRFPELDLVRRPQTYARLAPGLYAYSSPEDGYAATLHVGPLGEVAKYPGLFEQIRGEEPPHG